MTDKRKTDEWVRCPNCGHKLFKTLDGKTSNIEIKCHSCRKIILIKTGSGKETV